MCTLRNLLFDYLPSSLMCINYRIELQVHNSVVNIYLLYYCFKLTMSQHINAELLSTVYRGLLVPCLHVK